MADCGSAIHTPVAVAGGGAHRAPAGRTVGAAATAAAILRAQQKDASFLNQLMAAVSDVAQRTLGASWWLRHHSFTTLTTDLLYAALTTLSLRQTLGEEYTGILKVNAGLTDLPTTVVRHVLVFLHCFGPPIFNLCLNLCENSLKSGSLRSFLRPDLTHLLLRHLPTARQGVAVVQRAHLALFYIQGLYYHLANRLARVRYVVVRRWLNDRSSESSLRLLGQLMTLQLVLSLLRAASRRLKSRRELIDRAQQQKKEDSASVGVHVPPHLRCSLCLCARVQPALCTCGHIFCWACIHAALSSNGHQCPLCRYPVEPRQLIPLVNFR